MEIMIGVTLFIGSLGSAAGAVQCGGLHCTDSAVQRSALPRQFSAELCTAPAALLEALDEAHEKRSKALIRCVSPDPDA